MRFTNDLLAIAQKHQDEHSKVDIFNMLMEEVRILAATEASKERLRWHPCTDFLREFAEEHDLHVFHSAAETLVESFQVTYASYDYDECRNASFSAVVLFSLPSGEFEIHYEYRRHSHAMPGSNITFTLMFAEKAAKPERVLKYELHTPHAYPKMMYEEVNEEEDKQEKIFLSPVVSNSTSEPGGVLSSDLFLVDRRPRR